MTDTFYFELSESSDGTVDIRALKNDSEPFSTSEARRAVNTLQMIMAEEEVQTPVYCALEIYESSLCSARWRGDDPKLNSLRDYLWLRRRLEQVTHGDFSRYPKLPDWVINLNTMFLFVLTRIMQIYCAVFDVKTNSHETLHERIPEESLPESLDLDHEGEYDNVVVFPGREE